MDGQDGLQEGRPAATTAAVWGEYIVVKALEDGVTIIGMTRGRETRIGHSEKLDRGEVMVAQFTEHVAAMKIRGRAQIWTRHGMVESER